MNKTNRAIKCRIYPTQEQQILFAKTFVCCRFVYNKMLEKKISYYEETGKSLSITPASMKKNFPFLKEVDSLALANSQLNLQAAYKNFFRDNKIGFPKFKKKSFAEKYTTNNQNGTIRLVENKIKLPKVGFVKIKFHRAIPDNWVIKSATVSRSAAGKFYVSILFEFDHSVIKNFINENANAVGLDFSMHDLFISSDGQIANYPRFYRKSLNKLAKEQRKLSHCKLRSKNYYKQKRKVATNRHKAECQTTDSLEEFRTKHSEQDISKLTVKHIPAQYKDIHRTMPGALFLDINTKEICVLKRADGKHNGIPDYYVDEYLNKHLYNKCIVLQQNQGLRVL